MIPWPIPRRLPHFLNKVVMRQLTIIDKLLCHVDMAMRTLLPPKQRGSTRISPAHAVITPSLNADEKRHVAQRFARLPDKTRLGKSPKIFLGKISQTFFEYCSMIME